MRLETCILWLSLTAINGDPQPLSFLYVYTIRRNYQITGTYEEYSKNSRGLCSLSLIVV